MADLNEKALEAAYRGACLEDAHAIITTYFDSLAEQGIVLVDVREVVEFVRRSEISNARIFAGAIEARFAPEGPR